jgi:hydrogenase maturation protease
MNAVADTSRVGREGFGEAGDSGSAGDGGVLGVVGIVGLGGVLMGDDAFGPYVVAALEAAYEFPESVSVRDLGTPSLDMTAYLEGLDALVVVDTIHAAGEPGELRTYRRAEILRHPVGPRTSPHEPGLKESLLIAEFAGRGPREVLLVGVIPEATETGVGLSPAVRAAVPAAAQLVIAELRRLGREPTPRADAREPRVWWEELSQAPGREASVFEKKDSSVPSV